MKKNHISKKNTIKIALKEEITEDKGIHKLFYCCIFKSSHNFNFPSCYLTSSQLPHLSGILKNTAKKLNCTFKPSVFNWN